MLTAYIEEQKCVNVVLLSDLYEEKIGMHAHVCLCVSGYLYLYVYKRLLLIFSFIYL